MAQSIRISDKEFSILKAEKDISNRSIGRQAEYWMRIGRAVEKSPSFNYQNIKNALIGLNDPASLSPEEDAVYIDQFMDAMLEESDEQKAFFAKQRKLGFGVGLDANDNIVHQEKEA